MYLKVTLDWESEDLDSTQVLFLIVVWLWASSGLSFFAVKWEWVGGESSKFF